MSYIKNVWENGDKVTAKKLNNIENGIEELDNKTKIVEKGFKEFQIGDRFPSGYELTIDNSNGVVPSKTYYFYAYNSNGEYLEAFDLLVSLIKDSPIQFQWGFEATGEKFITNAIIFGADPEDIATFISEIAYYELADSSSVSGSGLLGGYGETELTLQNVYDNTKVVEKEFKAFQVGEKISSDYKITVDNVLENSSMSKTYNVRYVKSDGNYFTGRFSWDSDEQRFWCYLLNETTSGEILNEIVSDYFDEIDFKSLLNLTNGSELEIYQIDQDEGTGELGTWTEKQLTAQEVYDNNKLGIKTNRLLSFNDEGVITLHPEEYESGLYKVDVNTFGIGGLYSSLLYLEKQDGYGISVLTCVEDENENVITAIVSFSVFMYQGGLALRIDVCKADDLSPINVNVSNNIYLTRIL